MCEFCDNHQIKFGDYVYTDRQIRKGLDGIFMEYCPCCGRSLLDEIWYEKTKRDHKKELVAKAGR